MFKLSFNIEVTYPTSVYNTKHGYLHGFSHSSSKFKYNFTYKCFKKNIMNQVIERFCFKPRLNNTSDMFGKRSM